MAEFVLLLRSDRARFEALPLEDKRAQIGRDNACVGELIERGVLKDGLGLAPGSYELSPEGALRGPIAGGEPSITGLFRVEAADVEAALELARTHPALSCGETVVVAPIGGA